MGDPTNNNDSETKPNPATYWKSRFPVARIKKIMQADQDVGKVAQVTPVIMSKALELFMQSIIQESCKQTRLHQAKRVTVSHLKHAVQSVEQFDFLQDIVEKVPDAPPIKAERKTKRPRARRAANEGEHNESVPAKKVKKNTVKEEEIEKDDESATTETPVKEEPTGEETEADHEEKASVDHGNFSDKTTSEASSASGDE
ncbi:Transcription regulator complex subunit bur6 [Schizosaccharomyces pombe]|uniref:Transcription regulator complex subunit bur6 n=1 Tax=Schizosaccharomyces pombe (strain 972 / ATCC 24843) TaxID=284812 RepID=BUR6_SCHPO|nr:DNA polymerase epsilon subunit Dpb3 [Schizosaccharomyces pombe]Q10315.1 RecName: Full=Transcription regulator complex subunit bur6 [Schizosaccharomyces pombe 972h-]CAA93686.1 DNA polymerase epsilon subunit Dpb3 [Schizosaccharomyces pombe]|eukprot:NP_593726.1 DNA polymerase epsilon subunit Dpb3 [Schizosaccharomyces pombe]